MGKERKAERERFYEMVEIIRRTFPNLLLDVHDEPVNVDAEVVIPQQPELDFDVTIILDLDALHLGAGAFWVEWFPCGDQYVFDGFVKAAIGLISGTFRIVEYHVKEQAVKADLQRPKNGDWQTVAVWSSLGGLLPVRRTKHILQNRQAP